MQAERLKKEFQKIKTAPAPVRDLFANRAGCEIYLELWRQPHKKSKLIDAVNSSWEAVSDALRMGEQPEVAIWSEYSKEYSLTEKGRNLSDGFRIVAKATSEGRFEFSNGGTVSHLDQDQREQNQITYEERIDKMYDRTQSDSTKFSMRLEASGHEGTYRVFDKELRSSVEVST